MAGKNGFAISESDRRLIREHSYYIREALFSCLTETQVESSVAFARYLSRFGLNSENYWLFMRLILTNNPWVIDELLHDRDPRLLFSTIRPEAELIEAAFEALFSRHPEELYPKALEALLGIIQSAYFDPDDGFRIRKLSIMDINALGKFLKKNEPQEESHNRLILEILDRITHLGEYYGEPDKSVLGKHAFNVRFAYFDSTRNLVDAIPGPLLVRFPDRTGVQPEDDYADLVSKRRDRKRDAQGRFMKERPAELSGKPSVDSVFNAALSSSIAPAPNVSPVSMSEPVEQASLKPEPLQREALNEAKNAQPSREQTAGRSQPRKPETSPILKTDTIQRKIESAPIKTERQTQKKAEPARALSRTTKPTGKPAPKQAPNGKKKKKG